MSDWNTIHKELCRTDERKKKASKAERVAKGVGSENLWYNALLETPSPQMGRQAVEAIVNIFGGTRILVAIWVRRPKSIRFSEASINIHILSLADR